MVLSPCLARFQRKSSSFLRLIDSLLNQDKAASFRGSNEGSSCIPPGLGRPAGLLITGGEVDSIPLSTLMLVELTEDGHWSPGRSWGRVGR